MKRTLYIHDEGVFLYDPKLNSTDKTPFFSWAHFEALKQLLAEVDKSDPLFLILDVVDEDLSTEWKPKLFPWEKKRYLQLEQQRASREGVFLAHFEWMGITRKNNYDVKEELLFKSVIFKNERIMALLELIESLELPLRKIYSISYLIDVWFKRNLYSKINLSKHQLKKPFFLLVRLSKHRFRQLFYLNGVLRISRALTVDSQLESETAIQAAVMQESSAALKYLYNKKIVPYNSSVSMVIVEDFQGEEDKQAKWECFYKEFYVNSTWEEKEWFLRVYNFLLKKNKTIPNDQTGQWVFVQFAIRSAQPTYYHYPYLEQVLNNRRMTYGVYGSLVSVLSFILFYGLYQGITFYVTQQKIISYQQQIVAYQKVKNLLQNQFRLPYDSRDLKAVADFSQAFLHLKKNQNAGINWLPIMQVLDNAPHIKLQGVAWRVKGKIDSDVYEVKLLGLVFPFKERFELPTQWVDQFVQALKAVPNMVEVKLVKEPLNRNLKEPLTIKRDEGREVQALPFVVLLQVKR
ncbi:hypothetical protein [Galenea microaerophila]